MDAQAVIDEERRISELYAPDYRHNTLTNSYPYQLERRQFADWVVATLVEAGHDPGHLRVLDVGCGSGEILELLRNRGIGRLAGLDLSGRMLVEARRHLPEAEFFLGEIDRQPDIEGSVQVITAAFLVHHLHRPQAFFELVDRLLAPGGWFFILDYNRASWSRKPGLKSFLLAPTLPARALLKMKNRGALSRLAQVPALFNPAHRLLTVEEMQASITQPSDYEVRVVTRGLWLASLKHSLDAGSRFDRQLTRGISQLERLVVPSKAGHFQWVAGRRR
jgi:SAM-dependent methyltransferase